MIGKLFGPFCIFVTLTASFSGPSAFVFTLCQKDERQSGDSIANTQCVRFAETATQRGAPTTGTHSGAGLEEQSTTARHLVNTGGVSGPQLWDSRALTSASSCPPSAADADVRQPSYRDGTSLMSGGYDGPCSSSGAAADAAAWLAAVAPGEKGSIRVGASTPFLPQASSGYVPNVEHASSAHIVSLAAAHESSDEGWRHVPHGLALEGTPSAGSSVRTSVVAATGEGRAASNGNLSASGASQIAVGGVSTRKRQLSDKVDGSIHAASRDQCRAGGIPRVQQLSHSPSVTPTHGEVGYNDGRGGCDFSVHRTNGGATYGAPAKTLEGRSRIFPLTSTTTELPTSGSGADLPPPRQREGVLSSTPSVHCSRSSRSYSSRSMQPPSASQHPRQFGLNSASPPSIAINTSLRKAQGQTSVLAGGCPQDQPPSPAENMMAPSLEPGFHPVNRARNTHEEMKNAAETDAAGNMVRRDDGSTPTVEHNESGPNGGAGMGAEGVGFGVEMLADVVARQQQGVKEFDGLN